jgi:small-conductance mechanosensitive channel
MELLTPEQFSGTLTVGVTIPVILTIAGQVPNSLLACCVATAALWGMAWVTDEWLPESEEAAGYVRVCARLLALTALGELALAVKRKFVSRIEPIREMRPYELSSLLICGFLVLGQILYGLQEILPGEIDSAVFLGIVIAAMSFSLRDTFSSFVGGLVENLAPRFTVGDTIYVDSECWKVEQKSLCYVHCTGQAGTQLSIPLGNLTHETVIVRGSHEKNDSVAVRLKRPASNRSRPPNMDLA